MSDAPKSKIWAYLFVVMFSAIIVALGAHELQSRFARKATAGDAKKLVRDLKGDPDEVKASLARKPEKSEPKNTNEDVTDSDHQDLGKIIDKIAP